MSSFVPATDSVFKKVDINSKQKEKAENCCLLSHSPKNWSMVGELVIKISSLLIFPILLKIKFKI